jgi:hypothetical protein
MTSNAKAEGRFEGGWYHGYAAPMTSNAKAEGRFGKQDFRYVADEDVYVCPAGEKLAYFFTTQDKGMVLRRYRTTACLASLSLTLSLFEYIASQTKPVICALATDISAGKDSDTHPLRGGCSRNRSANPICERWKRSRVGGGICDACRTACNCTACHCRSIL